ncbi:uncharacterized protein LOC131693286 [Topomyia yanbarensis]|uniref:uncharacterized protein LOC131693286 n=1 Tax=Topomyia yanbarensis TaxID=2498891 RepID=UPI00273BCBA0|nr:uncharacterized protein LOC131693286 [Topomyia yanbarensis]
MTETGLDDRIESLQLFGSSYNVFRCDRNKTNSTKSTFGGVLIAVAQQHSSSRVNITHGTNLEQVCVSAFINGRKLFLCAIYIPPDNSRDVCMIESHIASVRELCDKGSIEDTVLVCGDYNQPRLSWLSQDNVIQVKNAAQLPPTSSALIEGMDFLNLNQFNVHANQIGRVLDLVFCSMHHNISVEKSVSPLLPVDTHHPPLVVTMQSPSCPAMPVVVPTSQQLNYRRIDFSELCDYLLHLDWSMHLGNSDADAMTMNFCRVIQDWLQNNLPVKRQPVSPAWSTSTLRSLRRKRNACQRKLRRKRSPATSHDFHVASEAYRNLNAVLYRSYVQRVQVGLRSNPKGFWNFVNSKRKNHSVPSNVYLDGKAASSTATACELFANHFASVFAPCSASDQETEIALGTVPQDIADLSTFLVSPDMVIAAARKLKSFFSPGPDGIPAAVYCRCAVALAEPLSRIFNQSFDQAKFPEVWKQSYMFPVFKAGDKRNIKQFRGITNLSAGSKLFEIVVNQFILSRTGSFISPDQHGFMPGRSVLTNLLEFTSTCINCMEKKTQVDTIYTDLKAAFDRIDHEILLKKLYKRPTSLHRGYAPTLRTERFV